MSAQTNAGGAPATHRAHGGRIAFMQRAGRNLQVGDQAETDFDGIPFARVTIIDRQEGAVSQSGIMFRVSPPLRGSTGEGWYDADWFWPVGATP